MRDDFAGEFYGLPTYFITDAHTEACGQNVRVYHWEKRGNILAPQFIAVLSAVDLAIISRKVRETAMQTLNECIPRGLLAH